MLLFLCLGFLFLPACNHSLRYTSNKETFKVTSSVPASEDSTSDEGLFEIPDDYSLHSSGKASYYGNKFNGRKTASGERFDNSKYTAAHKKFPFGTEIVVENVANKKRVKVRINDRGPFTKNRILDVSLQAAKELDFVRAGTATIRIYTKKNK